jgi:Hypoxia induced protein conserved region
LTRTAVIRAEQASIHFGLEQAPDRTRGHAARQEQLLGEIDAAKPAWVRARDWAAEHRYGIVGVSWVASMAIALGLVRRNPHLTGKQKLVQSRVYAQGLTVAVLLASFMLEGTDAMKGTGRWETVKVLDPDDPEHKRMIEKRIHHERYAGEDQWRDMVEAEERKIKMMEEQKMRQSLLGPAKPHAEAH